MNDNNQDSEHQKLMERHRNRRDVFWTPYAVRWLERSEGRLQYVDDGHRVTIVMDVEGCGTLIITVEARFSALLKEFKWDQTAELRARIE